KRISQACGFRGPLILNRHQNGGVDRHHTAKKRPASRGGSLAYGFTGWSNGLPRRLGYRSDAPVIGRDQEAVARAIRAAVGLDTGAVPAEQAGLGGLHTRGGRGRHGDRRILGGEDVVISRTGERGLRETDAAVGVENVLGVLVVVVAVAHLHVAVRALGADQGHVVAAAAGDAGVDVGGNGEGGVERVSPLEALADRIAAAVHVLEAEGDVLDRVGPVHERRLALAVAELHGFAVAARAD